MKTLELVLERKEFHENYTHGKLYNGLTREFICDTLEDKNRDENKNGVFDGAEKKVYGLTAIPYGRYEIKFQMSGSRGKLMPFLQNVPHFTYVMIHKGNKPDDSLGCILVGIKGSPGVLWSSKVAFDKLIKYMEGYDKFYITIR